MTQQKTPNRVKPKLADDTIIEVVLRKEMSHEEFKKRLKQFRADGWYAQSYQKGFLSKQTEEL